MKRIHAMSCVAITLADFCIAMTEGFWADPQAYRDRLKRPRSARSKVAAVFSDVGEGSGNYTAANKMLHWLTAPFSRTVDLKGI